ncbi:hypothetical protein KM043_000342 [Ampulex compressa]|nr:hypothetical protein KM043_000342 [Ampulex compressa]
MGKRRRRDVSSRRPFGKVGPSKLSENHEWAGNSVDKSIGHFANFPSAQKCRLGRRFWSEEAFPREAGSGRPLCLRAVSVEIPRAGFARRYRAGKRDSSSGHLVGEPRSPPIAPSGIIKIFQDDRNY